MRISDWWIYSGSDKFSNFCQSWYGQLLGFALFVGGLWAYSEVPTFARVAKITAITIFWLWVVGLIVSSYLERREKKAQSINHRH